MTVVNAYVERMHGVNEALRVVEEYGKVELLGTDAQTVRFLAESRQSAIVSAVRALAASLRLLADQP